MRLKPKPKIRPGGTTREKSTVQPSVDDNEKTATVPSSITAESRSVVTASCDSQVVTSQASNHESVETGSTCLARTNNSSGERSDITHQTYSTSSTSNTCTTSSPVSVPTANVTSPSDRITVTSCKSSLTSCVTTTSTSVTRPTRPTNLSRITSLAAANFNNNDSPVSMSSSDALTDLFNDEELPNVVQAENVLICEDNSNNSEEDDDNEEEPTERHYPSFVESLSHIMDSHKALGLDQAADGEVQSSAVEGTLRQRCEESDDGMVDDCLNDEGENIVEGALLEGPPDKQPDDLPYVPEGEATDSTTNKKQPKPKKKPPAPKRKRKAQEPNEEQVKRRKKTSERGTKTNNKQTVFEAPDRSKMTMSDLTSYNPSANPMKSALEKRRKKRQNGTNRKDGDESTPGSSQSTSQKDELPDIEVLNEESARLVPQLTVGEDGQIILNEKSLTVEATQVERELDSEVVFESSNSYSTSHQFSRKSFYTKSWNKEETDKFYKTLSRTGTDFTLMTLWIPNRSRMELKRKFKREEKRNPSRVNQALKTNVPLFESQPTDSNDKVNT